MSGNSDRRIHGPTTEQGFQFSFDGREVIALPGETVAAALLADRTAVLRSAEDGSPRGVLCGIGVCWECRCIVDGAANSRACMTTARPGMVVETQRGPGR